MLLLGPVRRAGGLLAKAGARDEPSFCRAGPRRSIRLPHRVPWSRRSPWSCPESARRAVEHGSDIGASDCAGHNGGRQLGQPRRRHRRSAVAGPGTQCGQASARVRSSHGMDQLLAVAILGDVTVDLPHPRSSPQVVDVDAFAVVRDAEVLVAEGTMVQMFRGFRASERGTSVPCSPAEPTAPSRPDARSHRAGQRY